MSVKNDLKSLKRKVLKRGHVLRSGLTPYELHARSIGRFAARLRAKTTGKPAPLEELLPHEEDDLFKLVGQYSKGARERLAMRIIDISERRKRAEERDKERSREKAYGRALLSSFVSEKMQEIDQTTRDVRAPSSKLIDESGNPMIERLRKRRFQFADKEDSDNTSES